MGQQRGLSSFEIYDNKLYLWEDLVLMYQYYFWSIWVLTRAYYFSYVAVLLMPFYWYTMGPWKDMFTSFYNDAPIIISLSCFQVHIQDIFLLGMEVRSSLIFERVKIGNVNLCFYVCVESGLYHSGNKSYFQSFCWQ